ncbi:hypothetical protein IJC60_06090 [bacterium]|nr:hypothetical protein [bacterium]
MKKAFTLPEAIICVGIVAVIAAIMIPGLIKARPDEEKLMVKKAYNTTSEIISFFSNEVTIYSRMQADGFADAQPYEDLDGNTFQGGGKFCDLFKSKINLLEEDRTSTLGILGCETEFTSIDGIQWYVRTNPSTNLNHDINTRTDQSDYVTIAFKAPKPRNETSWWAVNVSRYGRISIPQRYTYNTNNARLYDIISDVDLTKN